MHRLTNFVGPALVLAAGFFCSSAFGQAVIELRPIASDGPHVIVGNEIRLTGTGQRVQIEVYASNWDPDGDGDPVVAGAQATFDGCSFSRTNGTCFGGSRNGQCCSFIRQCPDGGVCGGQGTPLAPAENEICTSAAECANLIAPWSFCRSLACEGGPLANVGCADASTCDGFDCTRRCEPAFFDQERMDVLFFNSSIRSVDISSLNFRFATASLAGEVAVDDGTDRYMGSLFVEVPAGATGTYELSFLDNPVATFLTASGGQPIPRVLEPTLVTILCDTNADCDDGSGCTSDTCNQNGVCENTPNFNDSIECCAPDTGATTPLSDGNECTDDICNPDGTVTHPPLAEFTLCGDPTTTQCDGPDSCDGAGSCLDRVAAVGTPCGDATDTDCDGADTCDGAGTCQDNLAIAGAACGDPADTQCDDPDTCDGAGVCLLNNVTDGTECDDGLFCNENEACSGGACTGGSPLDCGDGLTCTTDVCNDDTDMCESTLDAGNCLIDGICYGEFDLNPANDCEWCEPATSTSDWTVRADDSDCDDGDPCTGTGRPNIGTDVCTGGVCAGVPDPECNDNCAFAIEALQGTTLSNNSSAAVIDDTEASCQPDSNNDVWFEYTALCDAPVLVTTTGSVLVPSNDTVLSVLDACPEDGGVEVACDDDGGVDLLSALTFNAIGGETYFIRVAGFENNGGEIALNIDYVDDCLIDGVCYGVGETNPGNECQFCEPSLSTTDWSSVVEGTPCGDGTDTVCDSPDACNGAGVCETNFKPDGLECPDDGNECTEDFCITGLCAHPPRDAGFACGDPSDTECDNPDTCDGAGGCLDNFESAGFACGDPSDTQCDNPDICDGSGSCTENLEETGFPCDDGDVCTEDDICDVGNCAGTPIPEAPIAEAFGPKNVRVSPQPNPSVAPVALRVTSPDWACVDAYVSFDGLLIETPEFQLPQEWGTIDLQVTPEIHPESQYDFVAECGEFTSAVGSVMTPVDGDINLDGMADLTDILLVVDGFLGTGQLPIEVLDFEPCGQLDGVIDIRDILYVIDRFLGINQPCPGPCP